MIFLFRLGGHCSRFAWKPSLCKKGNANVDRVCGRHSESACNLSISVSSQHRAAILDLCSNEPLRQSKRLFRVGCGGELCDPKLNILLHMTGRDRVEPASITEMANGNPTIDNLAQRLSRHLHVAKEGNLRDFHERNADQLGFPMPDDNSIAILPHKSTLLLHVKRQRIIPSRQ